MMDELRVMSIQHGDDVVSFDPEQPADVERIRKYIKEQVEKGFTLYGRKRGTELYKSLNPQDITDKKIDEIILAKDSEKALAPPLTGG